MVEMLEAALRAAVMTVAVVGFARLRGLRSFSKMSGYDFSLTVAFGSILGSAAMSQSVSLHVAIAAVGAIFLLQMILAEGRRRWSYFSAAIDNTPLMLMDGKEILEDNLDHAQISRADLLAKLREANVTALDQIQAVVLETTGDVSVLHSEKDVDVGPILENVRRHP